jgi:hypothetical protein
MEHDMKNFCVFGLFLLILILSGCLGSPSSRGPELPRRVFQSIESGTFPSNEPSIVGDFIADDISFTIGSINFSTALFLSDAGILADVPKELFEKYATALFSQFPREGDVKEIIIPDLSLSKEEDHERDAYLFITKDKTKDGHDYYIIDSNIPIAGINSSNYDGYVMRLNRGFHKNQVPARWTSIMSIMFNNNILLYRGVAYPSKSAPLISTETAIGADVRMNAIISDQTTIAETSSQLNNTVVHALKNTTAENQHHADSMKFLEKSNYLSLSAYSYIDSDFAEANKFFLLAKETEAIIPNNIMGSKYSELEKIMEYLINIIKL